MTTLRAESVTRVFETRGEAVHAVQDVSLEVRPGELLVVTGPSGAGKTTLLNLLGGLDRPTSGRVLLGDDELSALGEDALAAVRRDRLGYVFQSFGLIPVLSAAENVEVPLRLQRMPAAERNARVAESLELVGLAGHAAQRPYELSGGQQQRVAIVRAIATSPQLLLLDEVTSALDPELVGEVLALVRSLAESGTTIVMATHEMAFARDVADRVVFLDGGLIIEDRPAREFFAAPREDRTREFLARFLPDA
ncbi:amino acid ABC transporter ATP-binding protein [Agromyces humi]|uniref:amino acid ABC transporter ATP-binding protein n=1 Tax=Agromyces humi TaxID=1766800 RepID=UPI0013593450|nr:ATP-binding cassette domain-containing protein [Agromyces humi]